MKMINDRISSISQIRFMIVVIMLILFTRGIHGQEISFIGEKVQNILDDYNARFNYSPNTESPLVVADQPVKRRIHLVNGTFDKASEESISKANSNHLKNDSSGVTAFLVIVILSGTMLMIVAYIFFEKPKVSEISKDDETSMTRSFLESDMDYAAM